MAFPAIYQKLRLRNRDKTTGATLKREVLLIAIVLLGGALL